MSARKGIFIASAPEDEKLRDDLVKHLSPLKQQGLITYWYDRKVSPGNEWEYEADKQLKTADIILLLISKYFLASDYFSSNEVKLAMYRHEIGEARVIPIILRPVIWESTDLRKLQVLPRNARAVTLWSNRDQAFVEIVRGIREALKELAFVADAENI